MATVSKNTWKLYRNSETEAEKNFKVDQFDDYLETLQKETILDGQYFKHALNATLKVNISQAGLDFFNSYNNINYISIQNVEDLKPVFYFVVSKTWTSKSTITFGLYMDTIMTFRNGEYTLSDKTVIIRQHENRFFKDTSNQIRKLVNKVNEELPDPVLYKKSESCVKIESSNNYGVADTDKFYLIYTTDGNGDIGENQSVSCYGCFNVDKNILIGRECWNPPSSYGSTYEGVDYGSIFYPDAIFGHPEERGLLWFYSDNITNNIDIYWEDNMLHTIAVYKSGNDYFVKVVKIDTSTGEIEFVGSTSGTDFFALSGDVKIFSNSKYLTNTKWYVLKTSEIAVTEIVTTHGIDTYNFNHSTNKFIKGIQGKEHYAYTRNSPRLIKIIELPYAPFGKTGGVDSKYTTVGTNFIYDSENEFLKMELTARLDGFSKNELFHEDVLAPLKDIQSTRTIHDSVTSTAGHANALKNESKLLNSLFYYKKFVYDSAGHIFALEDTGKTGDLTERTFYKPTSTANSKMAFLFEHNKEFSVEDYDNVAVISRNNQVTIFNSAYLNYLKNGVNYDTEKNIRQTALTGGLAIAQMIAGVAALALTPATAGATAVAGIGLIAGGVATTATMTANAINNEKAIEQKKKELQDQAASISGADDVDLLNAYSGNKAKIVTYEVSDEIKESLWNLFFHFGYRSNKRGVPTETGRIWFNFIQADVVFKDTINLSDDIIEDIKNRYKNGITVFHRQGSEWNFNQNYENWETFMVA